MNSFQNPELEVIRFSEKDIIATSLQEGISDDEMEVSFPEIFT